VKEDSEQPFGVRLFSVTQTLTTFADRFAILLLIRVRHSHTSVRQRQVHAADTRRRDHELLTAILRTLPGYLSAYIRVSAGDRDVIMTSTPRPDTHVAVSADPPLGLRRADGSRPPYFHHYRYHQRCHQSHH